MASKRALAQPVSEEPGAKKLKAQQKPKTSKSQSLTEVGQWVTIRPLSGRRASGADRAAAKTPALVTSVNTNGAVVVYPNPLVLFHNFGGSLTRIAVPLERLTQCKDAAKLKRVEESLLASIRQAARSKAQGVECPPEPKPDVEIKDGVESLDIPPEIEDTKAPSEKKVLEPDTLRNLTAQVSRLIKAAENLRMTKFDLTEKLSTSQGGPFDESTIRAGLEKLNEDNKVMLCDDLVFGIF
mmetsp:Transcript_62190/g.145731  ORF Transcript_62190/g.145731 Transcript_62190/m.145731 type:complete len:240 (-) Transcript_62190:353-1072(-)